VPCPSSNTKVRLAARAKVELGRVAEPTADLPGAVTDRPTPPPGASLDDLTFYAAGPSKMTPFEVPPTVATSRTDACAPAGDGAHATAGLPEISYDRRHDNQAIASRPPNDPPNFEKGTPGSGQPRHRHYRPRGSRNPSLVEARRTQKASLVISGTRVEFQTCTGAFEGTATSNLASE